MKNLEFQELLMQELVDVDGGEYEPYLMMDKESAGWVADGSATMGGILLGGVVSFSRGFLKAIGLFK